MQSNAQVGGQRPGELESPPGPGDRGGAASARARTRPVLICISSPVIPSHTALPQFPQRPPYTNEQHCSKAAIYTDHPSNSAPPTCFIISSIFLSRLSCLSVCLSPPLSPLLPSRHVLLCSLSLSLSLSPRALLSPYNLLPVPTKPSWLTFFFFNSVTF